VTPAAIGIAGMVLLVALLALRMPVAFTLMIVGFLGIWLLNGFAAALATMVSEAFVLSSYLELAVIPLFVLMGNLATASGMSRDLYNAAYAWIGHRRGGLASATVLGCAGFAAVCGSSVASAVTMGRVALPEMRRHAYGPRLATGVVAAGGTLGILIPPSTGFVIYAILTETSIGKLFLAGILPGLVLTGFFLATVALLTRIDPALGPPGPRTGWTERGRTLGRAAAVMSVILFTIGGLYFGAFTPVEAAAVGAVLALAIALLRRTLTRAGWREVLLETMKTTAMCFMILIGAHVFGPFLSLSHIAGDLAEGLGRLSLGPAAILAVVIVLYVLLGMFLEGFAILVLTLPIVLPLLERTGVPALVGQSDPQQFKIWFGVVMVILLEMGLISPPVGVNVFVVKGIAADVPMREIFRGIWPFFAAMLLCILLLIALPGLALFLPDTMLR
jgi:tripartite ATP-independent transporter DctM subunit